ncbi:hypothetical protein [Sphingosinicella sp. LY1275]|uniref:hypothetical protein n=1 Tax=Sphingosinicella sp. LY1275 TaxID=3095379 RepID=UPI002ADEE1A8|nr:hypothetical protein [Sphingosinicella sp. LY1275]MEA1015339.1 hypothetical protein [Sphingosinicella sp. LY1275]
MPAPWHIYEDELRWPISSGGLFLAKAVQVIGTAASLTWSEEMPTWMRIDPPKGLPRYQDAFDDDNNAIPRMHALFKDVARAVIAPSTYDVEFLSDASWVRDLLPDNYVDRTIPDSSYGGKYSDNETIDAGLWEEVGILACDLQQTSNAAWKQTTYVAKLIQSLVMDGKIRCYIRPVGGSISGASDLPIEYWEIDDPLPRLAWCGINMDTPLDGNAQPSHWIFVDKLQVEEAIQGIEQKLVMDHTPADPEYWGIALGKAPRKNRGYNEKLVNEVADYLKEAFKIHSTNKKSPFFLQSAIDQTGWRISPTSWTEAWRIATEEHPERRLPGRPTKIG